MRDSVRVHFHKLTTHRRLDDFIVGHEPTGAYLVVDEDGKAVVDHLRVHRVGETKQAFPDYDVEDIIEQFRKAGLIHRIGHRVVTEHRHITDIIGLSAARARWVRNPLVKGTLVAVIALGMALLLTRPELAPRWDWFFATDQYAALLPLAFLTFWGLQLIHETGHYLMMKATGHATGLSVVNKWHLLLPKAHLQNARLLDPVDAVPVHMAGVITDLLILSIATICIASGFAIAFFKLVALLLIVELLLQLTPMRHSDASRAIEHAYGINDLPETLRKAGRQLCIFCKNATLSPNERRVAKAWLPLVALGILTAAIAVFGYILPIILTIIDHTIQNLLRGAVNADAASFADGMLALLFIAVFMSLYSISLIRHHRLGERPWFIWMSMALYLLANFTSVFLISSGLLVFGTPTLTAAILFGVGLLFGFLFLRLMIHVDTEAIGFAKDTILPILAALTALLLMVLASWLQAYTGTGHPVSMHAISYATGMIGSLILF